MQSIAQTVCRHSPADEEDQAKKEMTSATRTSGRLALATALPMTSPRPEFCSMQRSTPPDAGFRWIFIDEAISAFLFLA